MGSSGAGKTTLVRSLCQPACLGLACSFALAPGHCFSPVQLPHACSWTCWPATCLAAARSPGRCWSTAPRAAPPSSPRSAPTCCSEVRRRRWAAALALPRAAYRSPASALRHAHHLSVPTPNRPACPPPPCVPVPADVLLASSTVRESIMIAAQLKLPRTMSHRDKVERVDEVLRELVGGSCRAASPPLPACSLCCWIVFWKRGLWSC